MKLYRKFMDGAVYICMISFGLLFVDGGISGFHKMLKGEGK